MTRDKILSKVAQAFISHGAGKLPETVIECTEEIPSAPQEPTRKPITRLWIPAGVMDRVAALLAQAQRFYDDSQPRDETGKWTDGSSGGSDQAPKTRGDYKKITTSDPEEAKRLMDEYKTQATTSELKNVVEYTETHFTKINGHLRSLDKYPDQPQGAYGLRRNEEIKQIDNFLADAPKFKGETYRRMALDQFDYNKLSGMMTPGTVFEHPAYMSTTQDQSYLDRFKAKNDDQYMKDKQYVVDFKVKGKNGVDITTVSSRPSEKEVLIPRGTKFKVLGATEVRDGAKRRLTLEIEENEG